MPRCHRPTTLTRATALTFSKFKNRQLTELHLGGEEFSDDALLKLAALTKLQTLGLREMQKASAGGVTVRPLGCSIAAPEKGNI